MSWSDQINRAHDRIGARYLALCLGLRVERVERTSQPGSLFYYLWPEQGYMWELADPPVSTTWAGMYRILNLIAESAGL